MNTTPLNHSRLSWAVLLILMPVWAPTGAEAAGHRPIDGLLPAAVARIRFVYGDKGLQILPVGAEAKGDSPGIRGLAMTPDCGVVLEAVAKPSCRWRAFQLQ
jgi:hypothetical protein